VEKSANGGITGLRCSYDPATRGGDAPDGRKVKATLHWVSEAHAIDAEVRLYDRLFTAESPGSDRDYRADLNPNSLEVLTGCKLEPGIANAAAGERFQFERLGYFCVDPDSRPGALVFNRTVALNDVWTKIQQRG
jgi:glutaminyl-tRNA synthetase